MSSQETAIDGEDELEVGFEHALNTLLSNKQEEDYNDNDNDDDDDDDDASGKFLHERMSKMIGGLSEKIDLFLSLDGKTRPRVSMVTNLCHVIWPCLVAALALFMVNQWLSKQQQPRDYHLYSTKLFVRLTTVASVFFISSVYVLGVKKIPAGMTLIVGGVHAFLMNRDIGAFWPAWIVASLWVLIAAAFLYSHENDQKKKGKKEKDASSPSLSRDIAVWALYSNLFCLSLPNITGFGGWHDPALLARSTMLLAGAALGHPTFQLFGWATVVSMVLGFFFPGAHLYDRVGPVFWQP